MNGYKENKPFLRKLGSSELVDRQSRALELCSKAMWDTTFTNSVGDVILDIHDISDVGECLG
ncbi:MULTISPECIES: hypothetical protein [Aphanizomenon]|uniref:hypothetical protein n=1 Tax=Aphanizomenon TaxID=1175 RepID=UPI000AD44C56|nr:MULTISPECIES: hypothetical protein [Aphanizomenon]MTJ28409.1 hypothetical protein [Aphanizomenon sp. UHCC 0183]QSV71338.1 MAG: hypothetical protein HEQ20_11890 [Aphanizomenon flos-aquae KM1D3_PB]